MDGLAVRPMKAGAYKAMRKHLLATHANNSTGWNGQYRRNYFSACKRELWRVETYGVEE